jgi:hypothetical protein
MPGAEFHRNLKRGLDGRQRLSLHSFRGASIGCGRFSNFWAARRCFTIDFAALAQWQSSRLVRGRLRFDSSGRHQFSRLLARRKIGGGETKHAGLGPPLIHYA